MFTRLAILLFAIAPAAAGQTTQSLLTGVVTDSHTGAAIVGAGVRFELDATGFSLGSKTDSTGRVWFAQLTPGRYALRVEAPLYQPQEILDLELSVGAYLEIRVRLRPLSDVWGQGQFRTLLTPGDRAILPQFGPDVDTTRRLTLFAPQSLGGGLEASQSAVIAGSDLDRLPLAGRDAYTLLVLQPGVASDASTARGLGLSVLGQRPSASNFLLDGVENNKSLLSGPLTVVAPESIQEYRLTTGNFSAEYGRTSGVVANAITRAGSKVWHGLGYLYGQNEVLNANGFQENRLGMGRTPLKQIQPGAQAGGPLGRQGLFVSGSWESLRSHSVSAPLTLEMPTTDFHQFAPPGSAGGALLARYEKSIPQSTAQLLEDVIYTPPDNLDRTLAVARIDKLFGGGTNRLFGRVTMSRVYRPDFIWSPYPDFISPLFDTAAGFAAGSNHQLSPNLTLEIRGSYSWDDLLWDRPHPDIPTLTIAAGTVLPGSPAFYAFRNRGREWEFNGNLLRTAGKWTVRSGGGAVARTINGHLTAGRDGQNIYGTMLDFLYDTYTLETAVSRATGKPGPDYERTYSNRQWFGYSQASYRATPWLTLNAGLRLEGFGTPRNTGSAQDLIYSGGQLSLGRSLFTTSSPDIAGRFGLSASLAGLTIRAAWGMFFDRPFDNLWQRVSNNGIELVTSQPGSAHTADAGFPEITFYEKGIRDGYSQNLFFSTEKAVTSNWVLSATSTGSLGRRLITTDVLNREGTMPGTAASPYGRPDPAFSDLLYRGSQGSSTYWAFSMVNRFSAGGAHVFATYTWSHAIDNQSDPLSGDFFDLNFTALRPAATTHRQASFTQTADSSGDRGNADFDQRQNFTLSGWYDLPLTGRFGRGWSVAWLGALRSGLPYSVFTPSSPDLADSALRNNRADLVGTTNPAISLAADGGRLLLNPMAFASPAPGVVGNLGRNAFQGPGLFSFALSLSKVFSMSERFRVEVRADAFNLLNHANLGNPDSTLGSPTFGYASYGRQESAGFPSLQPLDETPRRLQILLRLRF